jgi:hypothetical protein
VIAASSDHTLPTLKLSEVSASSRPLQMIRIVPAKASARPRIRVGVNASSPAAPRFVMREITSTHIGVVALMNPTSSARL